MLKDLYAWIEFMTHYNGVTFFRAMVVLPDFHLNMGYGATYGSYWIQERYPRFWRTIFEDKEIGITVLELFPILPLLVTKSKIPRYYFILITRGSGHNQQANQQLQETYDHEHSQGSSTVVDKP